MAPVSEKNTLHVGQVFGGLTVIEIDLRLPPTPRVNRNAGVGERAVRVRCECTTEFVLKLTNLTSDKTAQRYCYDCGARSKREVGKSEESMLYHTWSNIRRRTSMGPGHHPQYKNYGARGILLHEPWQDDFEAFRDYVSAALGPRPEKQSLDRIDNDGHYEPGNLRWADSKTQAQNKRPRKH